MESSRCIISLATRDKCYSDALGRLRASVIRSGFSGELMFWPPGRFPDGCPPHLDVPFAFKPYAFREALSCGKELVLWLDSACVVVRKLDSLFKAIAEQGYVLFGNQNYTVGEWASDAALKRFDLSRERAMSIREVNAAAVGLNMGNPTALEFLAQWYEAAREGLAFRGVPEALGGPEDYAAVKGNRGNKVSADPRVRGHRHDQTVAGLLAHRLGMKLTASGIQTYSRRLRYIGWRTVIVVDRNLPLDPAELTRLERVRRDKYVGAFVQLVRRLRHGRS